MSGGALVWCPFPNADAARSIAATLLEEKLIACANIVPAIESIFTWKGEVSSEVEVGVLFKTTQEHLNAVTERLAELHPYETPAIMGWLVDQTPPDTLQWLKQSLK
ncbi:divalent-cation tolerance protein CutA [Erythrobacter sp. SCSIO 43205]|uniref:divalent-cation tolerance protein CutA n=1 Tax=Erythrobacter sp. SCSIO 43205 TaxID=2779361 RepID=UPI001CAA37CF|nr:divalent-cation tolerance protein CutA [Erythrobacter sp. SCSIO 43205]UAB78445.1 divalent-cation tolerance protein CutA [Erythrobacter sp. SCSIO 43205]